MAELRQETDSFGAIAVPAQAYWGAQTQRSIGNFPIGTEKMPTPLIRALARVKLVAARVNERLGGLDPALATAIVAAAREVIDRHHADQFPLVIWQTGSGTQTNMNMNEVIAGRANELLTGQRGGKAPVHPNDHVNLSQSSNDSFPTAMHVAVAEEITDQLIPALTVLQSSLADKAGRWSDVLKIGRTHLQDAVPMTLGQAFGGYAAQLQQGLERMQAALPMVLALAQGGTAVGTGLNAPPGFAEAFAAGMADETGLAFRPADNLFEALASHDALVDLHGTLNRLAVSLNKIANDIRLLGSGPRAGLGELLLPENEPGSSIMPGKVNPTQAESLTMVCARVMGNQTTVTIAGAQGHLELNVFKPVIADAVLQSVRLLADGARSFAERCIAGIEPNEPVLRAHVDNSLMLVTGLAPLIGYDKAAAIAKHAHKTGQSLRAAGLELGLVTSEQYDAAIRPDVMAKGNS
jgi:fumarate hydratase, class II